MKSIVFISLVLFFFGILAVTGQDSKLRIGHQLGVSLDAGVARFNNKVVNFPTYITQYEEFKFIYRESFVIGGYYKLGIAQSVYLQTQLSYSIKGNRKYTKFNSYIYDRPDSTVFMENDGKFSVHYLDVPLTIHIEKIYSYFGAQFSYLLATNSQFKSKNTYSYNGVTYNIEEDSGSNWNYQKEIEWLKPFDYGLIAGFEYPLDEKINVGIRYYQGLQRINTSGYDFFINYSNSQLLLRLEYALAKPKQKKDEKSN
ncbi:MAG: hypothetical protein COA57_10165 [Flavobacteriales bacterium]|nr:MAG: hypothetical protein COA57_10165 [Flavobacteriales bacterium]